MDRFSELSMNSLHCMANEQQLDNDKKVEIN